MQALPPPRKVILFISIVVSVSASEETKQKLAHIDEYTPGRRTFATSSGDLPSHRSGFHSSASSPHTALLRLALKNEIMTFVFFLIGISRISDFPSADFFGNMRGRTTSFCVLPACVSSGQSTS